MLNGENHEASLPIKLYMEYYLWGCIEVPHLLGFLALAQGR